VDAVEIEMAKPARDQMVALQLGRTDVIDVPVESTRRASQEGVRLASSAPIELVAVVFPAGGAGDDARVRDALALSADRAAIFNVLLGRQGGSTAALLPDWMTGYAFLFDASQNVTRARQLRQEARRTEPLTLAYDPQDTLARAIAERIALDARAAGLTITPTTAVPKPDAKLVRILLPARDPEAALAAIAAALGGTAPHFGTSPEEQYEAERRLREELRVVPLVHVPVAYGIAPRVKGWRQPRSGGWALDNVWLEQRP
jgi:ABC-type transport system substrate-binding protein